MNSLRLAIVLTLAATLGTACQNAQTPSGATGTPATIAELPSDEPNAATVTFAGNATYRERMLLPSNNNRLTIELLDGGTGDVIYTHQEVGALIVPIPFRFEVPQTLLDSAPEVTLRATLYAAEQPFFSTPAPIVVYTTAGVQWPAEGSDGTIVLFRGAGRL